MFLSFAVKLPILESYVPVRKPRTKSRAHPCTVILAFAYCRVPRDVIQSGFRGTSTDWDPCRPSETKRSSCMTTPGVSTRKHTARGLRGVAIRGTSRCIPMTRTRQRQRAGRSSRRGVTSGQGSSEGRNTATLKLYRRNGTSPASRHVVRRWSGRSAIRPRQDARYVVNGSYGLFREP